MPVKENLIGTIEEVNATAKAGRASLYPNEVLGWNSIGAQSGALTGAAAASHLFSFRNLGANPVMIRRVGVGFIATTGFTAAQQIAFGLLVGRNWTASSTGGTAIAFTGSNGKHNTNKGTITATPDCRISTTAALTFGTVTKDANHLAQIGGWALAATAGVVIAPSPNNLFSHDPEDYPLILAQNEGIYIENITAMGAGGIGQFYCNFEVAELSGSYPA